MANAYRPPDQYVNDVSVCENWHINIIQDNGDLLPAKCYECGTELRPAVVKQIEANNPALPMHDGKPTSVQIITLWLRDGSGVYKVKVWQDDSREAEKIGEGQFTTFHYICFRQHITSIEGGDLSLAPPHIACDECGMVAVRLES